MSYIEALERIPEEYRWPMLQFVEALEGKLREDLAVRRQDFDELRAAVSELAEAQKRTEGRLDRLVIVVSELAEAQKRTEQRLAELAEAQKRTEGRLERLEIAVRELAEAQKRTEEKVGALAESQKKMQDILGDLQGRSLEGAYRDKAYAYFGRILRRPQVISLRDLEDTLETSLSQDEFAELLLLDVLIKGRPRGLPEATEVFLALEVSVVVDGSDVQRAGRRAALLRKAGYATVPVVAGKTVTPDAEDEAQTQGVTVLLDGRVLNWEAALESSQGKEARE